MTDDEFQEHLDQGRQARDRVQYAGQLALLCALLVGGALLLVGGVYLDKAYIDWLGSL